MSADSAPRLASLDAYRGFIMLAMASGGLGFARIHLTLETAVLVGGAAGLASGNPLASLGMLWPGRVEALPANPVWSVLAFQFDHVAWAGCAFWDLIQPSFMFMVGVAMPFSLAARAAKGDTWCKQFLHAAWRAFVLVALAIFLTSPQRVPSEVKGFRGPLTDFMFTNVLAQIGLGYLFLFLLAGRGWRVQMGAAAAIAVGYTLFFGLHPLPEPGYNPQHWARSVPFDPRVTQAAPYEGWFAHWNKNANAAHFFEVWFLNLFPRAARFDLNVGGYATLNFVPSLITMILGLIAGETLRGPRSPAAKFVWLVVAGVVCLAVGQVLGWTTVPIVKRIWTPSWAVYSAGWTLLILAAFFGIIDVLGWKGWEWPLTVVGMNSIAMYVMSQLIGGWVRSRWQMHLGADAFATPYAPFLLSLLGLGTLWLVCLWMYKKKIFLRI